MPWAKQFWDDTYNQAWHKYVIELPRAGDVSQLVSEVDEGGGCDHYLAANPDAR